MEDIERDFQTMLFLAGAFQGLLLAVVILIKSRLKNLTREMLVLFVLVVTCQILLKVISKDWIGDYFHALGIIAYQIPFLFGPIVYLYTRSVATSANALKASAIIHFFPFIIVVGLIMLLQAGFTDLQYVMPNNTARGLIYLFLQLTSVVGYAWFSYREFLKMESNLLGSYSDPAQIRIRWVNRFIWLATVTSVVTVVTLFIMYDQYPYNQHVRYLLLIQGALIYWVSYHAIANPAIFISIEDDETSRRVSKEIGLAAMVASKKYAHNFISEADSVRILEKVLLKMELEEVFLNPDLNIESLSISVGESRHQVSQVINERLNMNFFRFVNGYRVERARKLLSDSKMNHFTIAAIAFDCGFSSVSSFNIVFRKFEPITPSAYKKKMQPQAHVA